MSSTRKLNVQTFPRPPILERTMKHIQVKWHGQLLVDCPPGEGFTVLEHNMAPVYYIPPLRVRLPLATTPRTSFDEFRGNVTYYSIMSPINAADTIFNRIWAFHEPGKGYEDLKGHLVFAVGPWECYVDGERAQPHPTEYFGGWVTSDIEGLPRTQPQHHLQTMNVHHHPSPQQDWQNSWAAFP